MSAPPPPPPIPNLGLPEVRGRTPDSFEPCVCGHDHTTARLGPCGTFTCGCKTWRDPAVEPVVELARKIVAGGAYVDADAERVARAYLELAVGPS